MAEGISIVLADDHTVVRRALRLLLEEEPGFEVVAEAEDSEGTVRYVRGHKPTVLILDLNMPGRVWRRSRRSGRPRRRRGSWRPTAPTSSRSSA